MGLTVAPGVHPELTVVSVRILTAATAVDMHRCALHMPIPGDGRPVSQCLLPPKATSKADTNAHTDHSRYITGALARPEHARTPHGAGKHSMTLAVMLPSSTVTVALVGK